MIRERELLLYDTERVASVDDLEMDSVLYRSLLALSEPV